MEHNKRFAHVLSCVAMHADALRIAYYTGMEMYERKMGETVRESEKTQQIKWI